MRDTKVATEATGSENAVGNQWGATSRARHTQGTIGQNAWSIGLVRLIVVGVLVTENVEWAARRNLENRGHSEIREDLVPAVSRAPCCWRSNYCTEHKTVTLIKQRVGPLGSEVAIVLP